MTRSASGRPLRFFALILAGWVCIRILGPDLTPSLQPDIHAGSSAPHSLSPLALRNASAVSAIRPIDRVTSSTGPESAPQLRSDRAHYRRTNRASQSMEDTPLDLLRFVGPMSDFAKTHDESGSKTIGGLRSPTASPPPQQASQSSSNRWRAGAWLFWRQGSFVGPQTISTGQLGGSQAGLRLDYDIAPHAAIRMTGYGRLTGALQRPAAPEAAVGLSIQPVRAIPVTLATERRIALGTGGRNANVVMAVGGFGPTPVAPSIMAEAYVQAGIVGFRQKDAFIDGKISLNAPLSGTPLRLGAAVSGGAQPGAARLDIGPELQFRLPLPQANARLSVEWRQRIAGQARPGSGLAVTLAADF